MHKSSGKHMPDSSDEFKIDDSDLTSDSDSDRNKRRRELGEDGDKDGGDGKDGDRAKDKDSGDERQRALSDLISKTAVVPLRKLPDHVTSSVSLKPDEVEAALGESDVCCCYFLF